MRENNVDLYVTNLNEWGHLISTNEFDTSHLHNDMYNLKQNRLDWEKRYLHSNYSLNLDPNIAITSVWITYSHLLYLFIQTFLIMPF